MTVNTQQVSSWVRQGAAIAGIVVVGLLNVGSLPTSVRVVLTAVSGIILTIEHYVSDPSTGLGSPPPKSPPGGIVP